MYSQYHQILTLPMPQGKTGVTGDKGATGPQGDI